MCIRDRIAACEKREIVVMMDLVLNHSSHLHPWFLEARKDRNSKYHDFYIWKEGTKEQPPEGGGAFFGGSTWESVSYTHLKLERTRDPAGRKIVLR